MADAVSSNVAGDAQRVRPASLARRFGERFVGNATPGALGAIRIISCSTALICDLWEDLPSSAKIPLDLRTSMGVLELFYKLPIGFDALVTSATALAVLKGVTVLTLIAGALGFGTRVALPLSALGHFLIGGILRQYAWFYHTGLVPLYLLCTLSFTPCGDGWSVDAWLRRQRGQPSPDPDRATSTYGWARYACWLVIAVPYVFAGMSKLRGGLPPWWVPQNIKRLLLGSSLKPMHFDFDGALAMLEWPDWAWTLLGISAVLTELSYGSVLFSRWGRRIVPPMTALLHVGILLLQNILFFDLMLLQLVFVDVDRWRRRSVVHSPAPSLESASGERRAALTLGALTLFLGAWWVGKKDYYPLTVMKMFADGISRSTRVTYQVVFARRESGEVFEARLEDAIPALRDTRYREFIAVFGKRNERRRKRLGKLFDAVAAEWNRGALPGAAVVEFEVQNRVWDFAADPSDPNRGKITDRFIHRIDNEDRRTSAGSSRRGSTEKTVH
jgi:hypothetical protein